MKAVATAVLRRARQEVHLTSPKPREGKVVFSANAVQNVRRGSHGVKQRSVAATVIATGVEQTDSHEVTSTFRSKHDKILITDAWVNFAKLRVEVIWDGWDGRVTINSIADPDRKLRLRWIAQLNPRLLQ